MQITKKEFDSILQYVQKEIIKYIHGPGGGSMREITEPTLIGIMQSITVEEFLQSINEKKERKKVEPILDNGFEELWNTYPATANYTYKGMSFKSSRVLRANKQVCQILYLKGINENSIEGSQILNALKKLKKMALDESYESGQNKLEYWPSLEVWLRQERYQAVISTESEELQEEDNELNNCG